VLRLSRVCDQGSSALFGSAVKSTHEIFYPTIIEAHSINSLSKEFEQLKALYQNDGELEINDKPESTPIPDESDAYSDEKAFKLILHSDCCNKKCYTTKINHDNALLSFQTIKSLPKSELNMFLLGLLHAMKRSDQTHHSKTEKKYLTIKYIFDEIEICETAFLHIYSLSIKKWKMIRSHYQINGFKPILHGNKRRKSSHALTFETILHILTFIINYANIHGLPSPGRSFRDDTMAIIFLPVSDSYIGLYRLYESSLEIDSEHYISRWTFLRVWKKYIPEIKFLSPRSDLCFHCKNMRFNTQFWNQDEKDDKVKEWHEHITWANQERDYYRNCIKNSKDQLTKIDKELIIRPGVSNSLEFENHISWDFAEGVHLPYSSQQEGSIYFKSPWKVSIFGICEEAFPQQKNYLIQENENVGKGADAVISLVHHYFKTHGLGEKYLIVHADNCSGQNKNNAMIQYLTWRVMNGLHDRIKYCFMVAGHTKFSPDGFFGLIKLKMRVSEVQDLSDMVEVVHNSTTGGFNTAQTIYGLGGNQKVLFYKWTEFLNKEFTKIPQILQQHHFEISNEKNGIVNVQTKVDGEKIEISILKKNITPLISFPNILLPKKLSAERQWYLYEQIREHVTHPDKKDQYCSKPLIPKPSKDKSEN
ncbi:11968_t:CDS:2, partial [Rhizophagus irregularis]